jgi:hypothetical protein
MYNLKKEECGMRRFKKAVLLVLLASMVVGGFQAWGWTQSETNPQQTNPEKDLYSLFDLFLVRPAAALAGVAGAGILVLSLPFTIPTNSVDKAADMFVVAPFRFAFKREFPDEGI